MFELLAPVFAVAGGLLAGVPLILHLFRRTPSVKMPFSVVRFLTPSLPTTTRRSKLEHWPLMLLRMLAVALIALAFARPFQRLSINREESAGSADRIAVLIDASASMRRDGLREAVTEEIKKLAASLKDQDTVSIAAYSETSRFLVTAEEWKQTEPAGRAALIERAITTYEPDWLKTRSAAAMLEAADEVSHENSVAGPDGKRRVVLITDFQEGSELDDLRSGSWPDSVELDLRLVKPGTPGNAGLSLVEDARSGLIRVRVTNSGDAAVTKYSLQPFDANGTPTGTPVIVDVGGGQRRTVTIPEPTEGQSAYAGVELIGEPHVFDNVVDLPIDERGVLRAAHVGSIDANDPEDMRYYLQRVLDGNEAEPVEVVDLVGANNVVLPPPDDIQLVFVTGVVPDGLKAPLQALVDRGGVVVVALKSTEMAESVKSLLPDGATVSEGSVTDYAMLGQVDFSSSLMQPFADARFSDFSSIKFWKVRSLEFDQKQPNVRVIAKYDSGKPAIVELSRASGGRVVVLASGWQPVDSQWALSTRFPPMIQRLVRMANPTKSGHQLLEAGERISPEELIGTAKWSLTLPDGSVRTPESLASAENSQSAAGASQTSGDAKSDSANEAVPKTSEPQRVLLDVPGRWTLTGETTEGPKSMSLLVTVAASESRTEPLPVGQLQALGMSADVVKTKTDVTTVETDPTRLAQMDAIELETQQKFWRWCLLAGLACLAVEALVSAGLERRQQVAVAGE